MKLYRNLSACLIVLCVAAPAFAQQAQGTGPNYEARLSTLEDSMRGLNGRLEQIEFSIRQMQQAVQRMQGDTDNRLAHLEATAQQPAPAPVAPVPPPAAETTMNPDGTLGALKMQNGKVTGGVVNPKAPPLPDTPADYGLTPQEQYDQAFGLLRQADYDNAEKQFKNFIDKNPKDKLIDNAKYWYAETLYVRARFDESTVAFADAWQQNPQGQKAPDSLLKLSMSLAAINKTKDACVSLSELTKKYPNASASIRTRANEQRTKLKCAAQ
jgi:tol-pal system protein YbgF